MINCGRPRTAALSDDARHRTSASASSDGLFPSLTCKSGRQVTDVLVNCELQVFRSASHDND